MKFVELYLHQKLWLLPPSEVKFCVPKASLLASAPTIWDINSPSLTCCTELTIPPINSTKWTVNCHFYAGAAKSRRAPPTNMFWSCDLLTFIWDSLIEILTLSLNMLIPKLPRLCLLGTNNTHPWTKFNKKYIDFAFIAVIKCIRLPFIGNWITHLVYPNG